MATRLSEAAAHSGTTYWPTGREVKQIVQVVWMYGRKVMMDDWGYVLDFLSHTLSKETYFVSTTFQPNVQQKLAEAAQPSYQ